MPEQRRTAGQRLAVPDGGGVIEADEGEGVFTAAPPWPAGGRPARVLVRAVT